MRKNLEGHIAPSGLSYVEIETLEEKQKRRKGKSHPYILHATEEQLKEVKSRYPNKDELTCNYIWRVELRFGKEHFNFGPTVFINSSTKVKIFCNKIDIITGEVHGEFSTYPSNMFNPSRVGCGKCSLISYYENIYKIYVYEWKDTKTVYVGLTKDTIETRHKNHLRIIVRHKGSPEEKEYYSAVYKYCVNNEIPLDQLNLPEIKYSGLSAEEARIKEDEVKCSYINDGWNVLNTGKTGESSGSLGGGSIRWTKEDVISKLKECKTVSEVKNNYPVIYRIALRNRWLDLVFPNRRRVLTKEDVLERLEKFRGTSFKKLKTEDNSLYKAACRLDLLPILYRTVGYPGGTRIIVFNESYTSIVGIFLNTRNAVENLGISYSINICSAAERSTLFAVNGYGWKYERVYWDKTFQDKLSPKLKEKFQKELEIAEKDLDIRILEYCEYWRKLEEKDLKKAALKRRKKLSADDPYNTKRKQK